ncbi:MAG: (Fe-S)-binding protein [Dehalococcoidia bacterium]|nr:(Fe-S)-binding protein [Dehalococcoidia bacterium]
MLDSGLIANIRESGLAQGPSGVAERTRALADMGFPTKGKAEYAVLASCFLPSLVPSSMKVFRVLLDHYGIDYSLLPNEHCCGNLVLRQAARDKTGAEMKEADALTAEFLGKNLLQARRIGATKLIAFCVGCDLVYARIRESVPEEILWYPTLLARLFKGGRLEMEMGYYAGCHYHYRTLNRSLPDLGSALEVLSRIDGLRLNHLDNRLCCTRPQQLEALLGTIKSRAVLTPCGGCAMGLQQALGDKSDCRVVMLPEVVWAAISGQPL